MKINLYSTAPLTYSYLLFHPKFWNAIYLSLLNCLFCSSSPPLGLDLQISLRHTMLYIALLFYFVFQFTTEHNRHLWTPPKDSTSSFFSPTPATLLVLSRDVEGSVLALYSKICVAICLPFPPKPMRLLYYAEYPALRSAGHKIEFLSLLSSYWNEWGALYQSLAIENKKSC
jgi:hypothetical protein